MPRPQDNPDCPQLSLAEAPLQRPASAFLAPEAATMSSTAQLAPVYRPKDAIGAAVSTTLITGTAGLFASAVQNTLQKQNIGPWGVFTRTGGTVALFGARQLPHSYISYSCKRN